MGNLKMALFRPLLLILAGGLAPCACWVVFPSLPRARLSQASALNHQPSAREVAFDVILKRGGRGAEGALAGHPGLAGLSQRDRSFTKLLVATTERRQGQIDTVLSAFMSEYPPRGSAAPAVQAALRLGACQLLFLGTPAHAAVSMSVSLLRVGKGRSSGSKLPGPQYARLANAVLRSVARSGAEELAKTR